MATISGTITHGITLGTSGSYASPLTITSIGYIDAPGNVAAIYGPNTGAWYVNNQGRVVATGTFASFGVRLKAGGTVANSGRISASVGVYMAGTAGTVVNSGTIQATSGVHPVGVQLNAGGSVVNSGLISGGTAGDGIQILATAYVSVAASGTVSGLHGINIGNYGTLGPGTVINSGLIAGLKPAQYAAVQLESGGTIVNNAGATISGAVYAFGGPATIIDYGTISNPGKTAIYLRQGGNIQIGHKPAGATAVGVGSAPARGLAPGAYKSDVHYVDGSIEIQGIGKVFIDMHVAYRVNANANIIGLPPGTGGTSGIVSILAAAGTYPAATIVNYGTIQATSGTAISFDQWQATITNGAPTITSALITGSLGGIAIVNGPGTITNFGTIAGTAGTGIILATGSTLTNAGTIIGQGGTAVSMTSGTYANRLIVDPGASFTGIILGGGGAVELAVGNGSAGALRGFGPTVTNFSTLQFDSGATWTTEGSAAALPGTITGFATGDTIDVDGFVAVSDTFANNQLVLTDSASNTATLGIQGSFSTADFAIAPDNAGGTDVTTTVCFCRGTMISTDKGEVAVEELAVGDRVKTWSGTYKPIEWIGLGRDLVTAKHTLARPIIVKAGALADNVPRRDLYLTHGHALYVDGLLVPVENLVNYRSIVWDEAARVVEYYHIELADHDVVFAQGAPAETYYDADNRALFHNTRPGSTAGAATPTFAPVLNGGAVVDAVWTALYARAGGTIERDTTDDPDLHLIADGVRLDPAAVEDGVFTFVLAAPPAGTLRLCSRSGVPSLLGITRHDHRRLSVAISRIELRAPGAVTEFAHDAWLFRDGGCHPPESGYCWTDGEFDLPAPLFAHLTGELTVTVHTERPGMRYPIPAGVMLAA